MVSQDLTKALGEAIESSMGFIDLTEQCIKALEKVS